jgi:hypothetical protein
MNLEIINEVILKLITIITLSYLGSWWFGGLLTAIRDKKFHAIGVYIPLVAIWIKWIILLLIFK